MKILSTAILILACCGAHSQCIVASHYGAPFVIPCAGFVRALNPPPTKLPAWKPPTFGTTAAAIMAQFPDWTLDFFQNNPNLDAVITSAGPITIARLSTELKALDPTGYYTFWSLAHAAQKVSVANLRLLQAAFGPTEMASAMTYATPATLAAYNKLPVRAALPFSEYSVTLGGSLPPYDLSQRYLYDLYLNQLFSTNEAPTVAMHKTVLYAQVRMHLTIVDVAVLVGTAIAVVEFIDSPTFTKIQDWAYFASINPAWDSGKSVTITTVPDMTTGTGWPTIPDPGMPDFPPVDDGGGGASGDAVFQED